MLGRRLLDRRGKFRFHTTLEVYSLVRWDLTVVGHRLDPMVQKHTGCTNLVASTRIDVEERRQFLDQLAMEKDPSHKPLGLVEYWRHSCPGADLSSETCMVELGPSSLEEIAEEDRNHSLEQ